MVRRHHWEWVPQHRNLWTSNSTGARGTAPAVDDYGDDGSDNGATSVEGSVGDPIPGTADLSIANTVPEMERRETGATRSLTSTKPPPSRWRHS